MNKRIFLSPPCMFGEERGLIDEAFASNYIAPCGPMVERFERSLAERVGVPHACALSSCTAALDLLFHELGVGAGDTVFCSNLTFIASIGPAVHRGAEPVFIGSDAGTWTLSPELLEEALRDAARRQRLPKAVVAVDLYGQCCDYGAVEWLCAEYGVPLIVDAAEALGAGYCDDGVVAMASVKGEAGRCAGSGPGDYCDDGVVAMASVKGEAGPGAGRAGAMAGGKEGAELLHSSSQPQCGCGKGGAALRAAGSAGWAGVYSFNGNKIITSSGGGALVSRDEGVVRRAVKRSQQSREDDLWYEHREVGFNHRMSNIVAAIGLGQLMNLDRIIARKRAIFDAYRELLGADGTISFMPEASYGFCTRWLTVLQLDSGSRCEGGVPSARVLRVIRELEGQNIESRPVWKPMHMQPVFKGCSVYGADVDEEIFCRGLCLPSGTGLGDDEIERVSQIVRMALMR